MNNLINDLSWNPDEFDNDIGIDDIVITSDINNHDSFEFVYEKEILYENEVLINPYEINRHYVKVKHFLDARLYDKDIDETGWRVNRYYARSKYRRWLHAVRKEPGWYGFHRPAREITIEIDDDEGNIYINKVIPYRVPGLPYSAPFINNVYIESGKKNKKVKLLPQSKVKGSTIHDDNFIAKMFTHSMAKEIANIRGKLGLTQLELAKQINVDVGTIRNIELGNRISFNSEDRLVKDLAKALNIGSIKYHD